MSELPASLIALVAFIRQWYGSSDFIPLHAPRFAGHEKQYLNDCIDTTFVSSVGAYVDRFEAMMRELTGARYAIATVNGTAALHVALRLADRDRAPDGRYVQCGWPRPGDARHLGGFLWRFRCGYW